MRARVLTVISSSLTGLLLAAWIAAGQQPRQIDDAALKNAGKTGEEWLTYGLTPEETRYSPLKQLDTSNVNRLAPAWSYEIGPGGAGPQEATPLVWNGTIYGITNWSVVFAVDARTGKERWRWDPEVNQTAIRPKVCCGVVNRGLAIYQGKVIAPIIDGRLQALDAESGKELWKQRLADGFRATPLVAGDRIYLFGKDGKGTIVEASRTFKMIAQCDLEEEVVASPAVAAGDLFIRTKENLIRISKAANSGGPPHPYPSPPKGRGEIFSGR